MTDPHAAVSGVSLSRLQHQNANASRSTPPHAIGTREITDEQAYTGRVDNPLTGAVPRIANTAAPPRRGSGGSLGSLHSVDERSAFNAVEPRVEPRSARDAVGVVVEEGPGNGAAAGHESSPDNMQVAQVDPDASTQSDASTDLDADDPDGYDTVWEERINGARDFFEDPDSSGGAKILSLAVLFVICVSTMALVIETIPDFDNLEDKRNFFVLETICIFLFTVEYTTRLALAKKKCEFMGGGMNLIDLISIVPFYFDLTLWIIVGQAPYESDGGASQLTRVLRLFRLVRVFRVFKLGRNSKSLFIAFKSVLASLDTLGLMVFILCIMLVLFGAFVYNFEVGIWEDAPCSVEGSDQSKGCYKVMNDLGVESISLFISIPEAMWWTVVTVMTVGYGDIFPVTPPGKFVASMCMVSSIVILALPISVIGINFSAMWSADENSTRMKESPLKLHGAGVAAGSDLQMFNNASSYYLGRLRSCQDTVRRRLGQLDTELSDLNPAAATADPKAAILVDGEEPALSPQQVSGGSDEPFAAGTSCVAMEGMGNPTDGETSTGISGVLDNTLPSQDLERDQACNRLFALKVDEVCMRALYDRVMVYFPLRRIEEADDKELPREEADIGVQMMMLRTKHNAAVFARLQRQQKCIEEEFRAMQKFIKIDDVEPAIPDDDE